jgi:Transglycosylase SLT domain
VALRLAAVLLAASCTVGCATSDRETDTVEAPRAGQAPAQPPAPAESLPRNPVALAERLTDTHSALGTAIDRWRADGDTGSYPPPEDVTLWALHQQRIHLLLTGRLTLASRVLERLSGPPAAHLRATFRARRGLGKITPPTPGRYRTGQPEPAAALLRHYRAAQRRFGVPWPVLAAVNFVESAFGRMRNSSAAGAQGPMQFIPSTWEAYGMGGDVDDPRDAIMGAANYLRASGAPGDLRGALYAYNPSGLYVRAVLAYTGRIRSDPRAFLGYYSWQVYVRVPGGRTRRITGPGR